MEKTKVGVIQIVMHSDFDLKGYNYLLWIYSVSAIDRHLYAYSLLAECLLWLYMYTLWKCRLHLHSMCGSEIKEKNIYQFKSEMCILVTTKIASENQEQMVYLLFTKEKKWNVLIGRSQAIKKRDEIEIISWYLLSLRWHRDFHICCHACFKRCKDILNTMKPGSFLEQRTILHPRCI